MEILERIWEIIAGIGNAILGRFEKGVTGVFGPGSSLTEVITYIRDNVPQERAL